MSSNRADDGPVELQNTGKPVTSVLIGYLPCLQLLDIAFISADALIYNLCLAWQMLSLAKF